MERAASDRTPASSPHDRRPGAPTGATLGLRLLAIGPLLVLIILVAAISLLTPNVLKPVNIGNKMAELGVDALVRAINGEKVDSLIDSGAALVTKDNMAKFQ